MHTNDSIHDQVRRILLNDWDPHNVARTEAAHGTYDVYVAPLSELILAGAGEEEIIHFLKEREAESMCFPALGTSHLRLAARRLAALRSPQ